MIDPIAQLVSGTINGAMGLNPKIADDFLADWESDTVADIADRLGASVSRSVRASVADACATAGV